MTPYASLSISTIGFPSVALEKERCMKILFVGLGNLGSQVFDLFVLRTKRGDQFLVGGRNQEYLRERTHWTAAAALQLGVAVKVDTASMDVWNIDQTAQTISSFKPNVIFSSVTVQPSAAIEHLPTPIFKALAQARGGPWMPLTLVLVYKLMQAVKQTGLEVTVLNGGIPDNSHEVLGKVGLAPTSGIGNIANTIPPIKQAIAAQLHRPLEQVHVLFFAHTSVVQSLRVGMTGGAPFHLTAFVNGEDVTAQLDLPAIFSRLPLTLEHEYTQLLTAASAATVFDVLTTGASTVVHAPGPNGLPGGYPVQVGKQGLEVVLPRTLTLEEAIRINREGQKLDGIERVENDGTVYFTERNMVILKEMLGYECRRMPLAEVEQWARELRAKYVALASTS
jgi:hypothetical protein